MDNASNVIIIINTANAVHEKGQFKKDGKAYLFIFCTEASARSFIHSEGLTDCLLRKQQWDELVRSLRGSFSRVVIEPKTSHGFTADMLCFFMLNGPPPNRRC